MCSATWLHDGLGYQLFFNRDERHTRKIALPPRRQKSNGVQFIAPIDGNSGGTWIGVNECGLTLCLLNRYEDEQAVQHNYISRGLLCLSLLDGATQAQVLARVLTSDLVNYQPFTLAALANNKPAKIFQWTGQKLFINEHANAPLFLTSSSYQTANVVAAREQQFAQWQATNDACNVNRLQEFHRSHVPAPSAFSLCMHRDDAQTVSFSHVHVTPQHIEFRYYDQAPCQLSEPYAIRLDRYSK